MYNSCSLLFKVSFWLSTIVYYCLKLHFSPSQVFHPLRQPEPVTNPCLNNGGCEALCLLVPGEDDGQPQKVCQCPDNFVLEDDGLSCSSNCSQRSSFLCEKSLKCIPFWWKCDGQGEISFDFLIFFMKHKSYLELIYIYL